MAKFRADRSWILFYNIKTKKRHMKRACFPDWFCPSHPASDFRIVSVCTSTREAEKWRAKNPV